MVARVSQKKLAVRVAPSTKAMKNAKAPAMKATTSATRRVAVAKKTASVPRDQSAALFDAYGTFAQKHHQAGPQRDAAMDKLEEHQDVLCNFVKIKSCKEDANQLLDKYFITLRRDIHRETKPKVALKDFDLSKSTGVDYGRMRRDIQNVFDNVFGTKTKTVPKFCTYVSSMSDVDADYLQKVTGRMFIGTRTLTPHAGVYIALWQYLNCCRCVSYLVGSC
eukprot:TRINITY_DN64601_c0_g1_i1.p2 TRINITY_DN64601_c0_g1~~TRINITY_DN64601_c0_g1_i1.p2  ORF type:complete len:241 (+),score=30.35 TRINITY_DN64601_c0_g1_i1:61-723(+)